MIVDRIDSIILRSIHGSFFLINTKSNYFGDSFSLHEINATGCLIWKNIDGKRTIEELATILKSEIRDDIAFEVILNDVREFISILIKMQFVKVESYG